MPERAPLMCRCSDPHRPRQAPSSPCRERVTQVAGRFEDNLTLELRRKCGCEATTRLPHCPRHPMVRESSDGQSRESTGIYPGERSQIHTYIDRQPMVGAPPADPEPEGCNLGSVQVDARSTGAARRAEPDWKQDVDYTLLQRVNEFAYPPTRAPQVDKCIGQELSRTMISHLAAAVASHYRYLPGREYVLDPPRLPEGKHIGMLDQPEFVPNHFIARPRELSHRLDGCAIGLHTESTHVEHPGRNPGCSCRVPENLDVHWSSGIL